MAKHRYCTDIVCRSHLLLTACVCTPAAGAYWGCKRTAKGKYERTFESFVNEALSNDYMPISITGTWDSTNGEVFAGAWQGMALYGLQCLC